MFFFSYICATIYRICSVNLNCNRIVLSTSWNCLHRWWLLLWRRSQCLWEALILIFCDRVFVWSHLLLPSKETRKQTTVDCLSHISRVRNRRVMRKDFNEHHDAESHRESTWINAIGCGSVWTCGNFIPTCSNTSATNCIDPSWFSVTLCIMMFVEILPHHFHHMPDLYWGVHTSKKNPRDSFSHFDLN